jgi:hypothetical protein
MPTAQEIATEVWDHHKFMAPWANENRVANDFPQHISAAVDELAKKVDANQKVLLDAIAKIPGGGSGLPATVHISGDVDVTPPA